MSLYTPEGTIRPNFPAPSGNNNSEPSNKNGDNEKKDDSPSGGAPPAEGEKKLSKNQLKKMAKGKVRPPVVWKWMQSFSCLRCTD